MSELKESSIQMIFNHVGVALYDFPDKEGGTVFASIANVCPTNLHSQLEEISLYS